MSYRLHTLLLPLLLCLGAPRALAVEGRPAAVAGVLETARFRVLHTERARGAATQLARDIEGFRDAFGQVLGRDWPGVTEVRVGVGREELAALALPGAPPPSWAAALAYPAQRLILLDALTLAGPEGATTLRHELVHVGLGALGGDWPRWFQEGLAMNLAGEHLAMTQYATLFRAVHQERVFRFEDLAADWPLAAPDVETAYAQSAAFVAFLLSRHGAGALGQLVDGVRAGAPFALAFGKALRTSPRLEEEAWRQELPLRYGWLPLATFGTLLWAGAAGLCFAAWARRRRQLTLRLAEMAREEAAQEAQAAAAPEGLAPGPAAQAEPGADAEPPPPRPTLH